MTRYHKHARLCGYICTSNLAANIKDIWHPKNMYQEEETGFEVGNASLEVIDESRNEDEPRVKLDKIVLFCSRQKKHIIFPAPKEDLTHREYASSFRTPRQNSYTRMSQLLQSVAIIRQDSIERCKGIPVLPCRMFVTQNKKFYTFPERSLASPTETKPSLTVPHHSIRNDGSPHVN